MEGEFGSRVGLHTVLMRSRHPGSHFVVTFITKGSSLADKTTQIGLSEKRFYWLT